MIDVQILVSSIVFCFDRPWLGLWKERNKGDEGEKGKTRFIYATFAQVLWPHASQKETRGGGKPLLA